MSHKSDAELIRTTRNLARYCVETPHVTWVVLVATLLWGVWGYLRMPQRKDPEIAVRIALALCYWPGASSERIEELVTRRMEEEIVRNARIEKIESVSRTGVAAVYFTLDESVRDRGKEFDDVKLKLDGIHNLPDGAGPIVFVKDFGDTAALMLTVASPKVSGAELAIRAADLRAAIAALRESAAPGDRVTIVHGVPDAIPSAETRRVLAQFVQQAVVDGIFRDARVLQHGGFIGVDGVSGSDDTGLLEYTRAFIERELRSAEFHPDAWTTFVVRDLEGVKADLTRVAADKYTYRQLDDYTDLIARTLKTLPVVAKIDRSGLLAESVFLDYSQERLASYGVVPGALGRVLGARNITSPGGVIETEGKALTIDPSGEFRSEHDIGGVLVPTANGGSVYLRDLVEITRSYDSPPRFLNFYSRRDPDGTWRRTRAVTLAVQMKAGGQISAFAGAVDAALEGLRPRLPDDLVLARTSDQPRQVAEDIHLFLRSLEEAVVLVVLVSLIGFWEWRSALLMALSIPLTLAMTFGMMSVLGIDLQQVSIASLIIALGLLVDDPVVAGDAIKREMARGVPPLMAAWLGPTKLATAILFATITNIVAYLPYLLLPGDTGTFLYSLPVVITCSLVASRIVSMTFIPLLGYYVLRPGRELPLEARRQTAFGARYYRLGQVAIRHRRGLLGVALLVLVAGAALASRLKPQFFPQDHQYLSYVDVWLPEDAPLSATRAAVDHVERIVYRVSGELATAADATSPRPLLKSMTAFVGGGAPRFWFSVAPEQSQLNYAQVLIEVEDKHDTARLVGPLQRALSAEVPGALVDVRRLETGPPIGIPIAIRISGDDIPTLKRLARQVKGIFDAVPTADRARDSWGADSFAVQLRTDADRANLSGITNQDVAASSVIGMNGAAVGILREGNKQIPIVARLRMEERAQLADVQNLYVHSALGPQKIPLGSLSSIVYSTKVEQLRRRNQFRTVTISAFPATGFLPSEILEAARPQLERLSPTMPPGYRLEIGGEYEEQVKGFRNQSIVMIMSVAMIFLALVVQFRHAVKPFIVFAAIPFGIVGAFGGLWIMGQPFGFMAFLGVASLVGVIVSHIIVLFDFIEEARERGEGLVEALLDAGIVRLRPVLITVAATITALVPLAKNGGPLWEPMCYAQIGGLAFATGVTLVLVPLIYAVFVLDLKLVKWEPAAQDTVSRVQPAAFS
jgi:multidrug efflux pump subunit AcrB